MMSREWSVSESVLSEDQVVDVSDQIHLDQQHQTHISNSMDTPSRMRQYLQFTSSWSHLEYSKARKDVLLTTPLSTVVNIKGRIGSISKYGEAYECTLLDSQLEFAFKLAPLPPLTLIQRETASSWKEKEIVKLTTQLVVDGVCPNFHIFYGSLECSNVVYHGKRLMGEELKRAQKITKNPNTKLSAIFIINELASMDLNFWLGSKSLSQWKNVVFQIVFGLYSGQKVFGLYHNDLHPGNVLIHVLPNATGWWEYIVDLPNKGRTCFKLPNCGYLAIIWDFGESVLKESIRNSYSKGLGHLTPSENIDTVHDLLHLLSKLLPVLSEEDYAVWKWMQQIFQSCKAGKVDLSFVLETYFSDFLPSDPPTEYLIESFNISTYQLPSQSHPIHPYLFHHNLHSQ